MNSGQNEELKTLSSTKSSTTRLARMIQKCHVLLLMRCVCVCVCVYMCVCVSLAAKVYNRLLDIC